MELWSQFLVEGTAAFAGAFFAFLFVQFANFLKNLDDRKIKHYNALVRFESEFFELSGILNDNIYTLSGMKMILLEGKVHRGKTNKLEISKNLISDLHNLQLINKLSFFGQDIRKVNDDLENLFDTYHEVRGLFISKTITPDTYLKNINLIIDQIIIPIEIFLKDLENHMLELTAAIRIRIRIDIPFRVSVIRFFNRRQSIELSREEINREIEVLKQEINQSKLESEQRINKIIQPRKV